MIVNPVDKGYQQQSHRPNVCWEDGWLLVDETTEEGKQLAQKIIEHYPYYELVLDDEGNLIDIIPTERTEPEPPEPSEIEVLSDYILELEYRLILLELGVN